MSFSLGIALCILSDVITQKFLSLKNNIFSFLFFGAVAVFSAFAAADVFKTYCYFAKKILLPDSSISVVILFSLVCLYFALKKQQSLLKFSLLSLVFCGVAIILFTLLLAPEFQFINLETIGRFEINAECFIDFSLPLIALGVYLAFLGKKNKGAIVLGVTTGGMLLGVSILSSVLLFGNAFAEALEFPYLEAVSCVAIGRLFSRMDLILYVVYMLTSLVKAEVLIFCAVSCIKTMAKPNKI
ncbi:MAG: GerAB/ArcD/ProY family transporter [Clostridia bacterium]|nr:GerAB/ArcD/ProY family transporter [Clostridia bacterium]